VWRPLGAGDDRHGRGVNCFGDKDTGSFRLEWDAVVESQPEIIILMLCGYTVPRALEDVPILAAKPGWDDLPQCDTTRFSPWTPAPTPAAPGHV